MTQSHLRYKVIRTLIDTPLIFFALLIAYKFSPESEFDSGKPFLLILFSFSVVAWYIAAQVTNLYADLRSKKFSEEITRIVFTVFLFVILLAFFLFMLRNSYYFGNKFLALYAATLFGLVTIFKYILRKYLHNIISRRKLQEQIVLIGSTPAALDFYETVERHFYYGYECIGFLDNEKNTLNGCSYLGTVGDLAGVLATEKVDEVIIALPNSQHDQIRSSIETCDLYGKKVRIIPDLYWYASSNVQINNIGLLPVINLRSLPQDREYNKILKRTFDVIFSLTFFILLGWWLMPLIALLIRLTSKGPVIFIQERWGINNKKIICYKFRSMYSGSPETDEAGKFMQASPDDPRVTPVGRFLRKFNMDELPQFWNVLLGNMSVVGPRPHVTPLNESSMHNVERYLLRHLVKPGITGLAQVNGSRGETKTIQDMQKRVNYDLHYIHNWTFVLDCQIILQTIIMLIKGDENAY